jgi:hypothetical protein
MDMYVKTFLVFIHFSLAAYCLVAVISMDWKILNSYGKPLSDKLFNEIADTKAIVPHVLIALWGTGLIIVAYGAYTTPGYLANEKLWFKFFVVAALSLNGMLVHKVGNAVRSGVVLAALDDKQAVWLNLAGVISSLSWIWACFLGTARAWNDTLSFSTITGFYLASLAAGTAVALILHHRWKKKSMRMPV